MQHVHVAVLAHGLFCNFLFSLFECCIQMFEPHFHFDNRSFRLLLLQFELFNVLSERLELLFLLIGELFSLVMLLFDILQLG